MYRLNEADPQSQCYDCAPSCFSDTPILFYVFDNFFNGFFLLLSVFLPLIWIWANINQNYDYIINIVMIVIAVLQLFRNYLKFNYYSFFEYFSIIITLLFEISWICKLFMPQENVKFLDNNYTVESIQLMYLIFRFWRLSYSFKYFNMFIRLVVHYRNLDSTIRINALIVQKNITNTSDYVSIIITSCVCLLLICLQMLRFTYHQFDMSFWVAAMETAIPINNWNTTRSEVIMAADIFKRPSDASLFKFVLDTHTLTFPTAYSYLRSDNTVHITKDITMTNNIKYTMEIFFDITVHRQRDAYTSLFIYVLLIIWNFSILYYMYYYLKRILGEPLIRLIDIISKNILTNREDEKRYLLSSLEDHMDFDNFDGSQLSDLVTKYERLSCHTSPEENIVAHIGNVDESNLEYVQTFTKQKKIYSIPFNPINRLHPMVRNLQKRIQHPQIHILPLCDDVSGINSWEIEILKMVPEQTSDTIITIFRYFGIFARFGLTDVKLLNLLNKLMTAYISNPYHNYLHAIDVCHTTYRLLTLSGLYAVLPQLEVFSILIAALGHDVGHMARDNKFLINSRHPLAIRYNDVSPLENMHCATLYEIILNPANDCNIFGGLNAEDWKEARKLIIAAILMTDMTNHFTMVSKAEALNINHGDELRQFGAGEHKMLPCCADDAVRHSFLEIIMHTADIAGVCKPFNIGAPWASLLTEEFFAQGDIELREGLTVGVVNDRSKNEISALQMTFIDFIVAPLIVPFVQMFPKTVEFGINLRSNFIAWADKREKVINPEQLTNPQMMAAKLSPKVILELETIAKRRELLGFKMAIIDEVKKIADNPATLYTSSIFQPKAKQPSDGTTSRRSGSVPGPSSSRGGGGGGGGGGGNSGDSSPLKMIDGNNNNNSVNMPISKTTKAMVSSAISKFLSVRASGTDLGASISGGKPISRRGTLNDVPASSPAVINRTMDRFVTNNNEDEDYDVEDGSKGFRSPVSQRKNSNTCTTSLNDYHEEKVHKFGGGSLHTEHKISNMANSGNLSKIAERKI